MRLTLEIRESERNPYYIVYNDRDYRFSDIIGCGWTIIDAVNQFLEELNRLSFYDDDTPIYLKRDDIVLRRVRIFR